LLRDYEGGDLQGAFIVIAATDDGEINHKVAEEAGERRILVNVVDDPEHSDFIVPSYFRRGALTIAVSTAGRSPALARKIRTKLEKEFGAEYASLALLIDEVRSELKRQGIKVNGDAWQEAIDLDLLSERLSAGQGEKARAILLSNLEKFRRTKI
jgi:siroheme synthase-like protein